ncbi:hypothetical protein Back2_28140 [Nocardioides baekrokdamisoli]|uniref:Uncharacterized protein n=1 Tax=Nocardioides baekrokdamisoli TaxID=1804624 RepID=A0A3G9IHS9_9ACTN|nr:hypothetical protein [Nocardioides baekrokdamisoli]BBH18527.1 hypothetical protein Back2_28140 [Nocardioides baekrokdamisoli]
MLEVPVLPAMVMPSAPLVDDLGAERLVVAQTETWLATQTQSQEAVLWWPHWRRTDPVEVQGPVHLRALITALLSDDFAGLTLGLESDGPWAQVHGDSSIDVEIELHPHRHEGRSGGMYFERVQPVAPAGAAALGWAWVRRRPLPEGFRLDPRVIPQGSGWDVAL